MSAWTSDELDTIAAAADAASTTLRLIPADTKGERSDG